MKITIERTALLRALSHVQSVVERRNTIPILANVLVRAEAGTLSLTATDMDLEIVENVPAETREPGALTTPAHTLYDIVRKLPDGSQVSLESNGETGQLLVRAGRSSFRLGTLSTDDFPRMIGGEMETQFELPAMQLRTLIDRTRFAMSTEETRYYLNGIYLHVAEAAGTKYLRGVATDGHRLAKVDLALPEGAEAMPGVIVPRKTVAEVRKMLDDAADAVQIALSPTKIRVSVDDIVLTSKLIDGTFPDYQRVIPQGNDKLLDVPAKPFAAAVDRVATISTEKSRAVKLALQNGGLTLSANAPDAGSAVEEMEVAFDGGEMAIGFNARYLLDITANIGGETARFALADSASPTLVSDVDDTSALYVLMPMRV